MAKVSEMTEEERRRKLAELEARRRSGLQTYQQLTGVKRDVRAITAPVQGLVQHQIGKALTGRIPDELYVLPVPGVPKPLPADVLERQAEVAQRTGAWAQPAQGELSRDIEGALRSGREVVAGDQRLVVGKDPSATPLAGRTEYPPWWEHAKAFVAGEPGQASGIGLAGNTLEALARGSATGLNYLLQGKGGSMAPGPDPEASWKNALSDIAGAIAGTEGKTGNVVEGGMVARRGGGMGDYIRKSFLHAKEGRTTLRDRAGNPVPFERATLRDLWGPLAPVMEGTWQAAWLPAKTAVGTASEAAENLASRVMNNISDPDAPGAMDVLGTIMGAPQDYSGELARLRAEYMDRPLSQVDVNDPVFDIVGTAASFATDPLMLPTGGAGKALTAAAKKIPVAGKLVGGAERVATFDLTKLGSREFWNARKMAETEGVAEAADIASKLADKKRMAAATTAIETGEQTDLIAKAAGAARAEDAPFIRQLLEGPAEMQLRDRPLRALLSDIVYAPQRGLTTEERAIIQRARSGDIKPLFDRRYRLAQKLDIPVTEPHPWAAGTKPQRRALAAAKLLRQQGGRELAIGQEFGMLSEKLAPAGRMAHAPRADLPVKMEAAGWPRVAVNAVETLGAPFLKKPGYNPHARRTMAAMGDVRALRAEAADLLRSGKIVDPLEAKMYQDFITNPSAQNPANVAHIRGAVARHGVDVSAPTGTVEEANRLARERGVTFKQTGQDAAFVTDPVRAALADRAAVATKEMHAKTAQGVKEIVDLEGRPIAQPLADFLVAPRRGIVPTEITQDLQRFAKGTSPQELKAAVFNDKRMLDSLMGALHDKKLKMIGQGDQLARYMPTLIDHVVPRAVYDDLMQVVPKLEPGVLGRAGDVIAKAASAWVPILLNTFGFWNRNTFFGMFQVHLATSLKQMANPRLWRLAGEVAWGAEKGGVIPGVVRVGGKKVRVADLVDEARKLGVYEGGRVADLEGVWRQGGVPYQGQWVRKLAQGVNPFNMRRGALGLTKEPVAKIVAGRGMGAALGMGGGFATAENVQRTFIYLAKRADGMLPREAADEVVKFMFDYTGANLTRIEKTIRKWIPFYQWLKQSSLLTVDQMMKQPGKYAGWNRVYNLLNLVGQDRNVDPRNTPQRLLNAGAIADPFSTDTAEKRRYLKMERPGTQLAWTEDLAGQIHPMLKTGVELRSGKYLFGDMPISRGDDTNLEPNDWYRMTLGKAFPKVHKKDLLPYLTGQFALPGLAAQMLLAQMDPEQQRTNPRIGGMDEAQRLLNRLVSATFGPTPMQVNEQDVDLGATSALERQTKSAEAQQLELAKRRLKGRPFGFTDQETMP